MPTNLPCKQRILERLQTLSDVVDDRFETTSVANAKRLEELIELMFQAVCRRKSA